MMNMPTLTTIKYVVFATLLAAVSFFGWYSYQLTGELASVKVENVMLDAKAQQAVARELQAYDSCKITTEVTADVQEKNDKLSDSRTAILEALVNVVYPMTQENRNDHPQATTGAPSPSKVLADDARLSPELMRLLDNAYCSGNQSSCAQPAK